MAVESGVERKFGRREVATTVPMMMMMMRRIGRRAEKSEKGESAAAAPLTPGERDGDHPAVQLDELLQHQPLTPGGRCPCSKDPVTQTARTVSCTGGPASSIGGGRRVARKARSLE